MPTQNPHHPTTTPLYSHSHLQPLRPRELQVPILGEKRVDALPLRAAEGRGDVFAAPERPRKLGRGFGQAGEGLEEDGLVEPGVVREELGDGDWWVVWSVCVCVGCWMVLDGRGW